MNAFVLVILVLSAKAPGDIAAVGYYDTAKECRAAAAKIDASTPLILQLSCIARV